MNSNAQPVPALPFTPEEIQRSLSFVSFLQSDELKQSFQAVSEYDFARFNPETLSQEEAERLLSFLQIAEAFVPFAASQPILQSFIPAEIWKALSNIYQRLSPHKSLLETKSKGSEQTTNEYLENYKKRPKPMTAKEQIAYQIATKGKTKLEDILGKWPGDEPIEDLLAMLQRNK